LIFLLLALASGRLQTRTRNRADYVLIGGDEVVDIIERGKLDLRTLRRARRCSPTARSSIPGAAPEKPFLPRL
jgi:hypothetical protein